LPSAASAYTIESSSLLSERNY